MSMEDVEIVKVLYDYDAEDETCLTLRTGDIIYVINRDESGWYDGVLSSGPFKGKRAWFPSNFTKPIEKTPPTSPITNDQLPTGWKQKIAKDGSSYYYNLSTYQTVTSKEEIPKNPRQSMLLLKASSVDFEELRNLSSLQEQEPQAPTTDEQPKWDLLINEIFRGISDLNDAAKVEDKSKFLLHTSDVIKAIRELLINCSALRKDSPILAQHPQLRPLHIQLLSNTAKLVLAAKIASGIYPKPKSTTKMRYQAGQVLSSVRNFVAITQDLNIPLNSVFPENKRKTTIVVPITSDFELVKKLDVLSNNILTTSTEMISYLVQDNQINQIILLSKSVVDQVGQVFSLIDELKVNDLLNKEMISLVDDFKLKREILYECINDLITTTSTLLDSYAPNNTNKLLQKCLSLLMRSSENVIVCTKILIDKKQDYEQQLLEIEIQGIHDPNRDSMDLLNFFKSSKLVNTENSQTLVKSESKDSLRSISSYGYDPMELILNIDGQISGGTLTALVERLTLHDMTIDPLFMSSFLQTFRLFTTQIELLSLLKLRFNITPSHTSTQKWQTIKQTPVRLRVFNVLKTWIELYLTEGDMGYYEEIMGFITTTIRPIMPSMAMRVIETLKKKRDEIMVSVPHPKTPKLPKMIRNSNVLVQLDYADVAKQITIMETELFNKLLPEDLINYVFSPTKNVKVSKMTLFSTQLSSLVAESILEEEDVKKRAGNLKFWIKCASKLKEIKNYNGLMTILSALNSSTIHRLKKTWSIIQNKHLQSFEELEHITDHRKNFNEYRKEMKTAVPPFLPFLGLFLTDLTFSKDGNPDFKDEQKTIINYTKYFRISIIIQELQRFQIPYEFKPISEMSELIQGLMASLKYNGDANKMYERSIQLEAKNIPVNK